MIKDRKTYGFLSSSLSGMVVKSTSPGKLITILYWFACAECGRIGLSSLYILPVVCSELQRIKSQISDSNSSNV